MADDFVPPSTWPCIFTCDVLSESPATTGAAVSMASGILYALTGMRFGFTTITLRPVPEYPSDTPFPDGWLPWPGTQAPPLGAVTSGWGYYPWYWACQNSTEIRLPAPVHAVNQVKVDGAVLATNTYRLDNNRILRRIDGKTWPTYNNLLSDDTVVGSWSIQAQYGETIPDEAPYAVGALACQIIKGMHGEDCGIPSTVTNLARQGVTISMPNPNELFKGGLTGVFVADMFIRTWNPKGLRGRARVYSVDTSSHVRAGS